MTHYLPAIGTGCLLLMVQAGCSREKPAATSPSDSMRVAEATGPAAAPTAAGVGTTGAPGTAAEVEAVVVAPDNAGTERIAVDLRQLADPQTSPESWESAQARILDQGRDAVPVLSAGLSSGDSLEREMAAMMLAVIGEGLEEAEQPLRDALRDESAFVRANAATALCQLPDTEDAVIPVLAELLESSDPNLRRMAATNLGNYGPEAAPFVENLAGSLSDERPEVLMPVVELLGRIGPAAEAAAPKLRQIVFEQTGDVRAAATAALERIETPDE